MQRVRMLCTIPGSLDGITQMRFVEGREYDLPDDMLRGFIEDGFVELVLETKPEPKLETKRGRARK